MVWAPSNSTPQFTRDGGTTWHLATLNGTPLAASQQLTNPWWSGDVLAPDLVAPGTFYYFDNGNFYYGSDGGATWSLGNTSWPQDPHWVINVNIVPNPTKAGDVWMAFAPNSSQTRTYPSLHSTDGGKTFSVVNTITSANYVAFGKGPAAAIPTIYVHGHTPGATADAIYKSTDMGASWTQISDPALMQFGEISALEGDMRTQDLVHMANGGRGMFYGYGPGSAIIRPDAAAGTRAVVARRCTQPASGGGTMGIAMCFKNPNSHLPACWLHMLVCPRRYLAVLPARTRPSLFGSD
jgi:hypothetical protein